MRVIRPVGMAHGRDVGFFSFSHFEDTRAARRPSTMVNPLMRFFSLCDAAQPNTT
jgi:hypothetical protein